MAAPLGATKISGPSGLQGLTESQLWRDPNSPDIYKLATPSTPTGLSSLTPTQTGSPPQPTQTQTTPVQGSNTAFNMAFNQLMSRGKDMQVLQDQKNRLLQQMYDQPLTPEDLRTLSPSQQEALRSGDRSLLEFQIMNLNDTIKGRVDENTSALQYMLEGYKQDAADIERKRQQAQQNFFGLLDRYGDISGLAPERIQALMTGEMPTADDVLKLGKTLKSSQEAGFTLSPGQARYDAQGNLVAAAPETAATFKFQKVGNTLYRVNADGTLSEAVGGASSIQSALTDSQQKAVEASREAKAIEAGNDLKAKLKNYRDLVSVYGFEAVGKASAEIDSAYSQLKIAYKEAANLGALTGPDVTIIEEAIKPATDVFNLPGYFARGGKEGVLASIDQVDNSVDALLVRNRQQLKAKWSNYSEDPYLKILAGEEVTQEDISGMSADQQAEYDYVKQQHPDWSDDDIQQVIGFNSVGGDTKRLATAIGQFESGGNYKAVGPVTSSGDKAYGKYQVMGANIPSWTKEALGKSMTPQQFLADTAAQDKVAEYKMGKMLAQYKNPNDVASVWFSGRPLAKAGASKDVLGTSVPQYVKNVMSIYNRLG